MRAIHFLLILIFLSHFANAQGQECNFKDKALQQITASEQMEFIKDRFAVADFVCAIQVANELATTLAPLPGSNGIDARFSLRELALDIGQNTTYPTESRMSLFRAAAFSATCTGRILAKEEIQADVSMLLNAGKQFRKQEDFTGGLEALLLAIQLDRRLVDADRRAHEYSGIENLLPSEYGNKSIPFLDKIAVIAEAARGDNALKWFRRKLASNIYYGSPDLWLTEKDGHLTDDGDRREVIIERCKNMLRITNALEDIEECIGCGGTGWRWRPIMNVAATYEWLGMIDEGSIYIEKALQLVKNIADKDKLLSQYQFVFSKLLGIRYRSKIETEREHLTNIILSLSQEMSDLANSLNTQNAKEVRESLEKKLKEANIIRAKTSSLNGPTT